MRQEVYLARTAQEERFNGRDMCNNGRMTTRQVRKYCKLDSAAANLLTTSVNDLGLSARAYDKVLRVARTIADLDRSNQIGVPHINEAVNYRMLDRQMWM